MEGLWRSRVEIMTTPHTQTVSVVSEDGLTFLNPGGSSRNGHILAKATWVGRFHRLRQ